MALDSAKNFAKVQVSTGYDASAVSIVLTTGHGAKLPTAPFNAVWWNFTDYPDPSDDPNVEIVRVTVVATDTLTVTRAQESTSATTKNEGGKTYKMIAGLTAKVINTDLGATFLTAETDPVWVADKSSYSTTAQGDLRWLGISAKAADSDLLDGHDTSYFATASGYVPYTGATDDIDLGLNGITLTDITIGANTLNTTEWAYLDGQDQAVKTTSSPTFANIYAIDVAGHYFGTGNDIKLSFDGTFFDIDPQNTTVGRIRINQSNTDTNFSIGDISTDFLFFADAGLKSISIGDSNSYAKFYVLSPTTDGRPCAVFNVTNSSTTFGTGWAAFQCTNSNATVNNWAYFSFNDTASGGASSGGIAFQFTDRGNKYGDMHLWCRGADGGSNARRLSIMSDGEIRIPNDYISGGKGCLSFGAGIDANMGYDGTNFLIDPRIVGTGYVGLLGNVVIGDATAGEDFTLTFDGETNDGVITWMEDEDYFKFSDDILLNSTEAIYFRDTAINIASLDDEHLDITADTSIDINSDLLFPVNRTEAALDGGIQRIDEGDTDALVLWMPLGGRILFKADATGSSGDKFFFNNNGTFQPMGGYVSSDGTTGTTEDVEVGLDGGGSTILHFKSGIYVGRD